jgi:hypothetical protein
MSQDVNAIPSSINGQRRVHSLEGPFLDEPPKWHRTDSQQTPIRLFLTRRDMPNDVAFLIYDRLKLIDLLHLSHVSQGDRTFVRTYVCNLSLQLGNGEQEWEKAFKYLIKIYQALRKAGKTQPLSQDILPLNAPSPSAPSFRDILNKFKKHLEETDELDEAQLGVEADEDQSNEPINPAKQEKAVWIWNLCKNHPEEAVTLIPFLSQCLENRKELLAMKDKDKQELVKHLYNFQNLRLPNVLLKFIADYFYPDILIDCIEKGKLDYDEVLERDHPEYNTEKESHQVVRQLLEAQVDPTGESFIQAFTKKSYSVRTWHCDTPLHAASEAGDDHLFKMILTALRVQGKLESVINKPNFIVSQCLGWTPLMHAFNSFRKNIALKLIDAGADPYCTDPYKKGIYDLQDRQEDDRLQFYEALGKKIMDLNRPPNQHSKAKSLLRKSL